MNYDKPLFAMLIGMIVVIPIEIMALFFKRLGWITITNGEACSMIYMPQGSWILGLFALPMVGAFAIVFLYYLTKIIGTDYLSLKGMFIGMLAYSFIFAIFGTLAKNPHMLQTTLGNYIFAGTSGCGGAFAGFLMKKYLFKDSNRSKTT